MLLNDLQMYPPLCHDKRAHQTKKWVPECFQNKNSASEWLLPRNIVDNLPHVNYNDLKYEFGQYIQLHVTQKVANTMKIRTIGAIVLSPR